MMSNFVDCGKKKRDRDKGQSDGRKEKRMSEDLALLSQRDFYLILFPSFSTGDLLILLT